MSHIKKETWWSLIVRVQKHAKEEANFYLYRTTTLIDIVYELLSGTGEMLNEEDV